MPSAEIKILHLEDLSTDALLTEREIKKVLQDYIIHVVETRQDFQYELLHFKPQIVISDYQLPAFDGMSALRLVLEHAPLTPVIILTGSMNEDTAVDCLKAGATDYVIKGHIKRLGPAILNALEQYEIKLARQRAEVALMQSEQNFRRSISESPLGIRIVNESGKTIYTNDAFLKIHGFANIEELKNTSSREHLSAESYLEHQDRKEKRKNGKEIQEYELSINFKAQELRYIRVWRKEILWNGTRHFQVIHQDITRQKQLTDDLIKAKLKAEEGERLKTSFLQNISHEIRTPMNAIVGFSELLNNQGVSEDKRKYFTNVIVKSSNQLLSIITDIVKIASIESGQEVVIEKKFNLNSLISLLNQQFMQQADCLGLSFNYYCDLVDSDAMIISDEMKLNQILNHLLDNAFKFTTQGFVRYGYTLKDTFIEFFVQDSGIGIASDRREDIFERFRKIEDQKDKFFGGSGLGLSISKAYVELLGGKIRVESEPGKGSVFYFTIPYKIERKPSSHSGATLNDTFIVKYNFSKTLLIAEDEDSNFFVLEEMLSESEINIIRAENGLQAIEICRSFPKIDIILMDIKMPELNGYEAATKIKEFMPRVPIIAQTAYTEIEDKSPDKNFGCDDFITKPIPVNLLLRKLNFHICRMENLV